MTWWVSTLAQLEEAVEFYLDNGEFVIDVETRGPYPLDPRRNEVFWIVLAGPGRVDVIPFGHPIGEQNGTTKEPRECADGKIRRYTVPTFGPPPKQLKPAEVMGALKRLLFSDCRKIGHNLKFDLESLEKYYGEIIPGPYADTWGVFLLNENRHDYRLGPVVERMFKHKLDKTISGVLDRTAFSTVLRYVYRDGRYTWLLWPRIEAALKEQRLWKLFEFEMDVLAALLDTESVGITLDEPKTRELDEYLDEQLEIVRGELWKLAGREWNFNSNKDRQAVFYGKKRDGGQGLTPMKRSPKTGAPSCDDEALSYHIGNPLVDRYRHFGDLDKMSDYPKAWLGTGTAKRAKDKNNAPPLNPDTGRIHPNFKQFGTVTGRFSCVAADTLIDMPRDLVKQPDGVPITDVRPGDLVYAFDWRRDLVLRRVKWVGQTGVKQTVIVTVRDSAGNERRLRLTPDHLVRLHNGDWRPAGSLLHRWGDAHRNDGPRVMAMVKRTVEDGYVRIYPHAISGGNGVTGGGRNREHRFVMAAMRRKAVSTKADVHHIDGNRANNATSNLEYLSIEEHRGRRHLHPGWGQRAVHPAPVLYDGPNDFRVVSVEPGLVEPVWDMEVEEAHSFIANGVCVHNCSEPNLQNIPAGDTELGKQMRDLFIAGPGKVLVVADYAQIEYAFMAHFSRDPVLVRAFEEGEDFHLYIAGFLLDKPLEEVTKSERRLTKNTNFAVAYGAGDDKVAAMSGVSLEQAKWFRKKHRTLLPDLYRFTDDVIRVCRSRRPEPYVKTIMGRRRRLPAINWSNDSLRLAAERQAVNSVIQGSAADLNKLAMIRLNDLREPGMHTLLTVHDEFVFEAPEDKAEEAHEIVREAMTGPDIQKLISVPLRVDSHVVARWGDAK